MKTLLALLISLPVLAQAHCPNPIEIDNQTYCLEVSWLNGDKKIQGGYVETDTASPYQIPMGEVPQKWIHSKAEILVWKKEDSTHSPVQIEDFRVFPYMHMQNGHHHSASYDFGWNSETLTYEFGPVALMSMKGCWTLRWTTSDKDKMDESELLVKIGDYSNLSDAKNEMAAQFCEDIPTSGSGGHNHHSH